MTQRAYLKPTNLFHCTLNLICRHLTQDNRNTYNNNKNAFLKFIMTPVLCRQYINNINFLLLQITITDAPQNFYKFPHIISLPQLAGNVIIQNRYHLPQPTFTLTERSTPNRQLNHATSKFTGRPELTFQKAYCCFIGNTECIQRLYYLHKPTEVNCHMIPTRTADAL